DEKFQTLTVEGILMMKWKDDRLKWDPSSYSGIKMLRMKIRDIWVPDVYSLFSVKKNDFYKDENVLPVQVYNNGTLKWYPPTVFDVPCSAKYKHYPFDSHNCSIVFGAWTHTGAEIKLETLDIPLSPQSSVVGTEWMLTRLTHENELFDVDGYYIHNFVRVGFYLRRTSTIYRYVCVVPTIIVFITSMSGNSLLGNESFLLSINSDGFSVILLIFFALICSTSCPQSLSSSDPYQRNPGSVSGRREEEEGLDDRVLGGGQDILLDIHLRLRCPSRGSGVCLRGHKLMSQENGHFNITFD
ncbi:Neuronal acetylcholine receptor subunit non-alpha-3, partial [Araneus ventricosus]